MIIFLCRDYSGSQTLNCHVCQTFFLTRQFTGLNKLSLGKLKIYTHKQISKQASQIWVDESRSSDHEVERWELQLLNFHMILKKCSRVLPYVISVSFVKIEISIWFSFILISIIFCIRWVIKRRVNSFFFKGAWIAFFIR